MAHSLSTVFSTISQTPRSALSCVWRTCRPGGAFCFPRRFSRMSMSSVVYSGPFRFSTRTRWVRHMVAGPAWWRCSRSSSGGPGRNPHCRHLYRTPASWPLLAPCAEDEHRHPVSFAQAAGQVHHSAAVRVNQYSGHGPLPSKSFPLGFSVVRNVSLGKDRSWDT